MHYFLLKVVNPGRKKTGNALSLIQELIKMKTYSFETNRQSLIIKIVLGSLLFTLVFTALTMVYAHKLIEPVFFAGIIGMILPLIFIKKLVRREEVTIKDNGFYIKSQERFITWKELSWYKLGRNSSQTVTELLEFGIVNGKKVSFYFYKKSKENNDWADFKKNLIHYVGINHPGLKNYYQRKGYQLYARYIYVIWILAAVIQALLGASIADNVVTTGMFIAGTYPLQVAIKRNQSTELN